jgi:hypothetical protein
MKLETGGVIKMTKDEALKMAIEALDSCDINIGYNGDSQYYDEKLVEKAFNACKEALEQPAQEPVGYITNSGLSAVFKIGLDLDDGTPLYARSE